MRVRLPPLAPTRRRRLRTDREAFEHFAAYEALPASPLYAELARIVARDAFLTSLASPRLAGEPPANMLFGAVHRLLVDRPDHPLAAFYGSMTPAPRPPAGVAPAFESFCRAQGPAIRRIVATRRVQTNEARRSGVLLPALGVIARAEGAPIALVDVGTSAGFTLLVDRFRITYGGAGANFSTGPAGGRVAFTIEARGARPPPPPNGLVISAAVGIDLLPVDPSDDESRRWLEALVWPEQADRRERLVASLAEARAHPPRIVEGDAVDVLPAVLASLPAGAVPVVVHQHVLSKISDAGVRRIDDAIIEASRGRTIHRLGNDFARSDGVVYEVEHRTYRGGAPDRSVIARCAPHASWIEWLGP